jgi:catechol 2,3-dioxygenase-like lactoylglutathione lyase family enzyme
MELGWCDVCLRVKTVAESQRFYAGLGFAKAEGKESEGWAVVTNGRFRIGLFEPQHMRDEFTLNFRGGNVPAIAHELGVRGYAFEQEPKPSADGSGSALLRDPDGHAIFFDTFPGEITAPEPMPS